MVATKIRNKQVHKVFLPAYVTIVAMVILAACHCKAASLIDRISIQPNKRGGVHPCDNVKNNTVVHTLSGDVVCRLPSKEKLKQKLDIIGGYNRHYVSSTLDEARVHFKNLFEGYGEKFTNTSNWRAWHIDSDASLNYEKEMEGMDAMNAMDDSETIEVQKRESSNSSNIQCLAGGRETAEGIHFCPACQRYTELPANIYPRYINELTCDDSQSGSSSIPGCFLGQSFQIGTCRQINMTIDLLSHQNGQFTLTFENATVKMYEAVYDAFTRELRISCECLGFPELVQP
uniref:Uncharacterized skeletal organic matrix protein 8-like n=1 Tax=Actinia tenebrosa TaxID=6105 RepID=A0A6P8H1T9_ACTTE